MSINSMKQKTANLLTKDFAEGGAVYWDVDADYAAAYAAALVAGGTSVADAITATTAALSLTTNANAIQAARGKAVSRNRTLLVGENIVRVTLSATGGTNSTLTFPDVTEAAGQEYFIYMDSDGNSNELVTTFPGHPLLLVVAGTTWTPTNLTVDADCIRVKSDGLSWICITDNTN